MLTPLFSIKDLLEIPTLVNRLDSQAGDFFRKQIVEQMKGREVLKQENKNFLLYKKEVKAEKIKDNKEEN